MVPAASAVVRAPASDRADGPLGTVKPIAETHMPQGDMLIRDILDRMRHDGCGGRAGRAELLTGIDGSSRPVRRIVLRDGGYDRGDL